MSRPMCRRCWDICEERQECLRKSLEQALVIIAGEYPEQDERYIFAVDTAAKYGLDLGENG